MTATNRDAQSSGEFAPNLMNYSLILFIVSPIGGNELGVSKQEGGVYNITGVADKIDH